MVTIVANILVQIVPTPSVLIMTSSSSSVLPFSPAALAERIACAHSRLVLVDIRPCGQFCASHIKTADSVNFSSMLLRRIAKGVVEVDSLLSSSDLLERLERAEEAVLYDSHSTAASLRPEVMKYAEILCTKTAPHTIHFIDGGFAAFSTQYPSLCEQSTVSQPGRKSRTSLAISVSSSLPVSCGETLRQRIRLQTPTCEDESSRFGPPVEVLPHLVLGCAKDSANLPTLRSMGVTAVLNVSHNCPNHFETLFDYKGIPVEDSHSADLLSQLQTAFDFIELTRDRGGRVFVHCHAGISRSATVCIAYMMKYSKLSLTTAYDFVKGKRPCISPNLHFMGQLLELQHRLAAAATSESASLEPRTHSTSAPSLLQCSPDSYQQQQQQQHAGSSSSLPSTPVASLGGCRVQCSLPTDCCRQLIATNHI